MKFQETCFYKNYQEYDKIIENSSMRCTLDGLLYWKLLQEFKFKKFLEIGVYQGLTSGLLLESNPESSLLGIDPELRLEKFNALHCDSVKQRAFFIENQSQNVVINDKYDFILIDGDHRKPAVYNDFLKFVPLLEPHGVLAVDDFKDPGVSDSISCLTDLGLVPFFQLEQTEFWHYPQNDRSKFLDNLLLDPISDFIFFYNISRLDCTVLKAKTIKLLTNDIGMFSSIVKMYNV